MFDGVAAERPTGAGREQRIARRTAAFDEPRLSIATVNGTSGVRRCLRPLPIV